MYNYFMLIGIVYDNIELKTSKNGKKYVKIPMVVSRGFKNSNGEYDADFFHIFVWEALADIASENFKKGSKIGIKGRIQARWVTLQDETVIPAYNLVAERLIYFDSKENVEEYEGKIHIDQDEESPDELKD